MAEVPESLRLNVFPVLPLDEFCKRLGLELEPWQKPWLEAVLRPGASRPADRFTLQRGSRWT